MCCFVLKAILFHLHHYIFIALDAMLKTYYLRPGKNATMGYVPQKSGLRLTKFLVNNIHSYVFKLIYYKNIFRN